MIAPFKRPSRVPALFGKRKPSSQLLSQYDILTLLQNYNPGGANAEEKFIPRTLPNGETFPYTLPGFGLASTSMWISE
jgi:hypothetical protein